jgi:rRNA maturation endonuclease Nob1
MTAIVNCPWSRDSYDYHDYLTGCGHAFTFNDGGPKENDFKFCPYCGDRIWSESSADGGSNA